MKVFRFVLKCLIGIALADTAEEVGVAVGLFVAGGNPGTRELFAVVIMGMFNVLQAFNSPSTIFKLEYICYLFSLSLCSFICLYLSTITCPIHRYCHFSMTVNADTFN